MNENWLLNNILNFLKILVSNPSLQYTLRTVKALNAGGHDVIFATVYWYRPRRLFEIIVGLLFPAFKRKLSVKSDPEIESSKVQTRFSAFLLQIFNRVQKKAVEESSYIDDCWQDKWVAKWIKKNKPDLVIGYEKSCLKTFTAAKKYGATTWLDLSQVHPNYIATLREIYPFFKTITGGESLFQAISRHKIAEYEVADKIFSLSQFAKSTLSQNSIDETKVVVNSLGYDPSIFYPSPLKTINNKPLKLIYAGIITKRKGIHLLLGAINSFQSREVELILIGPKGDASYLIDTYESQIKINYIEACAQDKLADYFREADVFVFPSYLDSWAAVVPEAMACGLPVITTNTTGASQMLSPDAGIVFEPGNKEQLKNAIQYFIDHKNIIPSMGKIASEQVKDCTWNKYQQQLLLQLPKSSS
jgi:glycosyltransferase involved in cell wall biosynthesis